METEENQEISGEVFGIILGSFLLLIGIKYIITNVIPKFLVDLKTFWINYAWGIISFVFLILIGILIFVFYKFILRHDKRIEERVRRDIIVEKKKTEAKKLLKKEMNCLNSKELLEFKKEVKDFLLGMPNFPRLVEEENLERKLIKIEEGIPIREKEEKVWELVKDKRNLEEEIRNLGDKKREREKELENDKKAIQKRLKIDGKEVFKIKGLKKKELEILKEEKYTTVNEYCVFENKVIPALVRKVMNHTKTHVFLVWSVRCLLESVEGVVNIKEHETRDADLTFEYLGKKYAIEIETGSLIRKPRQMVEKKAYLNRKYKKRWFVIVSNRNLLSKYKTFGIISTRKNTSKALKEMLKLEEY